MADFPPQPITILGLPFMASYDSNGDYITVEAQSVNVQGSPLVVNFEPAIPEANFENVGVPQVQQQLATALNGGGVTFSPYQ